jgi:hypothetical protein
MPSFLAQIRALPSFQIAAGQFVCVDGVQGDFFIRPCTGNTDIPIGVSQLAYDLPPNFIAALTNNTATYTQVAAQPGEELAIYGTGDLCPIVLGSGGCTAGSLLGFNAAGAAVMVAQGSGLWYGGVATQAGNSGEIIRILTHFGKA